MKRSQEKKEDLEYAQTLISTSFLCWIELEVSEIITVLEKCLDNTPARTRQHRSSHTRRTNSVHPWSSNLQLFDIGNRLKLKCYYEK